MYSRALLKDILEWDVGTFQQAIFFWDRRVTRFEGAKVLDLGTRHGGLSLYFALKGCQVVSTDLHGPTEQAIQRFRRHGVSERITCACVDATAIDFPDGTFDMVSFKSMLGHVGYASGYAGQEQAISEMYRVLKPGGILLFVENLRASFLHTWFRSRFLTWGKYWRYLDRPEVLQLLSRFREVRIDCYGFFATFGRTESQRAALHILDVIMDPLIPKDNKYIVFGYARK